MRTIKGYSLISGILLMTSCWTAKFPTHGDKIALNNNNYQLFNGTYQNTDTAKRGTSGLWTLIDKETDNRIYDKAKDTCKHCLVTIKSISANKFTATLTSPQQLPLKTIKLKYRIRRGGIKTKTQYHIMCRYVVFWGFYSYANQLTINKERQLIVDNHPCAFGFALFMMDGRDEKNDHNTFIKINTP